MRLLTNEQIKEITELQRVLDERIRENNGIDKEKSLGLEKYIALKTEFFEFVNEIESKIIDKINIIYNTLENLDYKLERKEFALKYKHMGFIFSIAMKNYRGNVDDLLVEIKNVLLKTYNSESKIKEFLECFWIFV